MGMKRRTVKVTYWLPPELKALVDEQARVEGRLKSMVVERALLEYLKG